MSPIKITGRNRPNRFKPSRTSPYVRFRRSGLQERIDQNKINQKKRIYRSNHWLGLLTPVGLTTTLTGFVALVGSAWFFIFSTSFLVSDVTITQATSLNQVQLNEVFYKLQDQRILYIIPGNHIFFLNEGRLAGQLNRSYPHISGVANFDRKLPNKVSFAVAEKKPEFVLISDRGQRHLLDREGEVLGEAATTLPDEIIMLKGNLPDDAKPGVKVISIPALNFATAMQKSWPQNLPVEPVQYEILTEAGSGEFKIVLNEGWYIKADGQNNPRALVANLQSILENEVKDDESRGELAYIDLRLLSRAFYCLKNKPCAK